MKKALLTFSILLILTPTFCQKIGLKVALTSGLFSFTGKSTTSNSFINANVNQPNSGYTNNPFGSNKALCYGVSATFSRFSKRNFIVGVEMGYAVLRSSVDINGVSLSGSSIPVSGETIVTQNFINLFPHIGQRLTFSNLSVDIIGGLELGRCLKMAENGRATAQDGTVFTTFRDRKNLQFDVRPTVQLAIKLAKIGAYVGYSYGVMNYLSGSVGGTNDGFGRLIRFGLTYEIQ